MEFQKISQDFLNCIDGYVIIPMDVSGRRNVMKLGSYLKKRFEGNSSILCIKEQDCLLLRWFVSQKSTSQQSRVSNLGRSVI